MEDRYTRRTERIQTRWNLLERRKRRIIISLLQKWKSSVEPVEEEDKEEKRVFTTRKPFPISFASKGLGKKSLPRKRIKAPVASPATKGES